MPRNPSARRLLILSLLAGCQASQAADKAAEKVADKMERQPMITSASLDPSKVQGSLGQPLGKLITVEGQIRAGDAGGKAEQGKLLLEVTKLDGKPLPKPVSLAIGFFAFTGIAAPKAGSAVKYQGYETGSFQGIPSESFRVMPAVASEELHFEPMFQVCKLEK